MKVFWKDQSSMGCRLIRVKAHSPSSSKSKDDTEKNINRYIYEMFWKVTQNHEYVACDVWN